MPDRGYLTHLATDAGAVIKQRFGERVAFQEKARYDLVSDVDKEVEALIVPVELTQGKLEINVAVRERN